MAANESRTISVKEFCGPHCVAREEAGRLYERLIALLKSGQTVMLDFAGIETLASPFLNVALGRVYGELQEQFVDEHLQWSGTDEADTRLIQLVIENAKRHYKQTAKEQAIQERLMREHLDEDR
jgi:hypothetical protein